MTVAEYNRFCRSLAHTTYVVQWGGAHVWKVAGKVFAIAWFDDDPPDDENELLVTFKVSDLSFELLKEMPGCRPAPYLASRGMKWIQRTGTDSMDDAVLRDYITESHRLVALGLPKRKQLELGIGLYAGSAPTSTAKVKGRNAPAKRVTKHPIQASSSANRRSGSKSAHSLKSRAKQAGMASRGEAR